MVGIFPSLVSQLGVTVFGFWLEMQGIDAQTVGATMIDDLMPLMPLVEKMPGQTMSFPCPDGFAALIDSVSTGGMAGPVPAAGLPIRLDLLEKVIPDSLPFCLTDDVGLECLMLVLPAPGLGLGTFFSNVRHDEIATFRLRTDDGDLMPQPFPARVANGSVMHVADSWPVVIVCAGLVTFSDCRAGPEVWFFLRQRTLQTDSFPVQ